MQHNKNTEFVMYVDNFLSPETLESLQETFLKLNYSEVKNPDGQIYGYRHTFPHSFHNDPLLQLIKKYFFPNRNLLPISVSAHLRQNDKEPLFHVDVEHGNVANFLLFVKGKSLLGFIENRALFFNGSKIAHSDLQSFGDSSKRYTLNIFYKDE